MKEQDVTLGAWGDDFTLVLRSDGVAVITLDSKGGANSLSSPVIERFGKALDAVRSEPSIKALVLASGKRDIFIVGADIREIMKTSEKEVAKQLTGRGHVMLNKLFELAVPVVAAVDGTCFGAGLELILCCDKRIATDHPSTLLGLPEVNIGLIPGLGGTQRLHRLIGLKTALEMILSAEPVSHRRALEIGLVDELVERDQLIDSAAKTALSLAGSGYDRQKARQEQEARAEESDGGKQKRLTLLKITERAIRAKTRGLYASPKKAIEAIERGISEGMEAGLLNETELFAELAVSQDSKNMINFYISREMAVQMARRAMDDVGRVTTVGVVGGGRMGLEIAEASAARGLNVLMKSSSPERARLAVEKLTKRIEKIYAENPDMAHVSPPTMEVVDSDDDLRAAQLVIENVYEDIDLKNKIIYELSRAVPGSCILASNTSSFAISNMSQFSNKPERVIGLHFFSPVDRLPLVEVVTHERTDPVALKKAMAFVYQLGKVPLQVKDSPGFLVNRLLTMFLDDAARMGSEQIPLNWIEDAALNFGMPISPFWLFDELGWDLCNKVCRLLYEKFGKRFQPPEMLDNILPYGYDGKKTNLGLYHWDETGKRLGYHTEFYPKVPVAYAEEKPDEATATLIRDRLFLPMIDEAARCLEDKVVRKARDIDLALGLGIAFPRFRGGLLRYADDLGLDYVVDRLKEIYSKYEPKREISDMLLTLQKEGRRFYGLGQN